MKDERMSSPLSPEILKGLALDWAVGHAAGYKLRFIKAGETVNDHKWNDPHIFRYVNNGKTADGITRLPKLELFKPTEDWEQLPVDYKDSYDFVCFSVVETNNLSIDEKPIRQSHDSWIAAAKRYFNGEYLETEYIEGDTKLEAICRAYVSHKLVLVSVPAIVIESDISPDLIVGGYRFPCV